LLSRSSRFAGLVFAALLTGACAREAPSLPAESAASSESILGSLPENVRSLTCGRIAAALAKLAEHDRQLESVIGNNRSGNQAAGYIAGVIFPPAILAAENNGAEKTQLDRNQKKRDELLLAQKAKRCAATTR